MDGILAPWHWAILIVVILLVFGPKKLPELGHSLGRGITEFKKGLHDVQQELTTVTPETPEPDVATPGMAAVGEAVAVTEAESASKE